MNNWYDLYIILNIILFIVIPLSRGAPTRIYVHKLILTHSSLQTKYFLFFYIRVYESNSTAHRDIYNWLHDVISVQHFEVS